MGWLATLLACVTGPIERHPSIIPPTRSAVVRVVTYQEQDISKVAGRQNVHSYVTFEVLHADPQLLAHAVQGELKVNMARDQLSSAGTLPLTVGTTLELQAKPNYTSPPYVVVQAWHAN